MQLGSLVKANFKAEKSLTAWEYLQKLVGLLKNFKNVVVFLGNTLEENKVRSLFEHLTMMRFQEENGCYNSNLDCNQTINQLGVDYLVLGLEECDKITHSQQQPQVPKAHKKK